jgi:radical SAM superfamily enzyme YgiQ (UPF0313 family)
MTGCGHSREVYSVVLIQTGNHGVDQSPRSLEEVKLGIAGYGGSYLGLGYLASILRRDGFNVLIIDALSRPATPEEIINEAAAFDPNVVGFTVMHTNVMLSLSVADRLRCRLPGVPLVFGGHQATFTHEVLAMRPEVDVVVRGDAEHIVTPLFMALSTNKSFEHLPGLSWKGKSCLRTTEIGQPEQDLDKFPFPARDTYFKNRALDLPCDLSIITSRGCPSFCTFCDDAKYYRLGKGQVWRARSPENVVNELEQLVEETNHDFVLSPIDFFDPNYFGHGLDGIERALKIADMIIGRGLKLWYGVACRAEDFLTLSDDALDHLEASGLSSVFIGLESGGAPGLKMFGKGKDMTPDINADAALRVWKRGLRLRHMFGFIMFHPLATLNSVKEDVHFLSRIHASPLMHGNQLRITAGTSIVKLVENSQLLRQTGMSYDYDILDKAVARLAQDVESYRELSFFGLMDGMRTRLPTWYTIIAKSSGTWPHSTLRLSHLIEKMDEVDNCTFNYLYEQHRVDGEATMDWSPHLGESIRIGLEYLREFRLFLDNHEVSASTSDHMINYAEWLKEEIVKCQPVSTLIH